MTFADVWAGIGIAATLDDLTKRGKSPKNDRIYRQLVELTNKQSSEWLSQYFDWVMKYRFSERLPN